MAYFGYRPMIKQFLSQLNHSPSLIEVGVDKGITLIPIVAFLARTRPEFTVIGVDILVQESTRLILQELDLQNQQRCHLVQENSLTFLPKLKGMKFDVVLIDGDHNYHTVKEELQHLNDLTHDRSLVIIDDIDGRWAGKDLWYADREGYEVCSIATKPIVTEKQGGDVALQEFLAENLQWKLSKPILNGEPVVLTRSTIKIDDVKILMNGDDIPCSPR